LLLQVRNERDPMREQEVRCFVRALETMPERIEAFDLLRGAPSRAQLDKVDAVLLGGSGDYSVAEGGPWLAAALEAMRELHDLAKPTFASCWGFQAMSRALGGEVETDPGRAELGANPVRLTAAGARDPVFSQLPSSFCAVMGHQDVVDRIPADAVLLASSDRVANQAFTFPGKPIYCTQFHPELNRQGLLQRLRAYPLYVERIAGMTADEFESQCVDTPEAATILPRFLEVVFGP
jgi:GMP synthase (glutamine-hydrolysing)